MTEYYDNHTLYLSTFENKETIKSVINSCINEISKKLGVKFNYKININVVKNRQDESIGVVYVWISDPKVYNVLLGKNLDGSKRTETIKNPDWNIEKSPSFASKSGSSWADIVEFDELEFIEKELPPLFENPIKYSKEEEQLELEIRAAYVQQAPTEKIENVLISTDIPSWVTVSDIQKEIQDYIKISGEVKYPEIVINQQRVLFLNFRKGTKDAQFFLCMSMKIQITKRDKNCLIILSLCYNKKRR